MKNSLFFLLVVTVLLLYGFSAVGYAAAPCSTKEECSCVLGACCRQGDCGCPQAGCCSKGVCTCSK